MKLDFSKAVNPVAIKFSGKSNLGSKTNIFTNKADYGGENASTMAYINELFDPDQESEQFKLFEKEQKQRNFNDVITGRDINQKSVMKYYSDLKSKNCIILPEYIHIQNYRLIL